MSTQVKSKAPSLIKEELYLGTVTYKLIPKSIVYGVDREDKHILSKGMLDGAKQQFNVLRDYTGAYKLALTEAQKEYIIEDLQLGPDDLNTAIKDNPFLQGISVDLGKDGISFDLSNGYQMLLDGVLRAYTLLIAPNLESASNKRTYRYVRTTLEEIDKSELDKSSLNKRMYKELDKIEGDRYKMLISILNSGGRVAPSITDLKLRQRVTNLAESSPRKFLDVVSDPLFQEKGTLKLGVLSGVIKLSGRMFYFDSLPLARDGEVADELAACNYLKNAKNKDILLSISKSITDEFG